MACGALVERSRAGGRCPPAPSRRGARRPPDPAWEFGLGGTLAPRQGCGGQSPLSPTSQPEHHAP